MSQISKALKKAQELREIEQEPKSESIVYLTDVQKSWPKTVVMVLFGVGIVLAIVMSAVSIMLTMAKFQSKQMQVLSLEKTIKTQGKEISDLTIQFNKSKVISDSQIRDLNSRLKKETKDFKSQIDNLALSYNENYGNLKEAILIDKQEMEFLDNYTKKLNQRIEAISVSTKQALSQLTSQTKDVASPSSGT